MNRTSAKPPISTTKNTVVSRPEVALDEGADGLAEVPQQRRLGKEAQAPRGRRGNRKHGDVELRHPAQDGDHLVGEGRQPGAADDPRPPFVVGGLELPEGVGGAVELDQGPAHGVEQEEPDAVAGEAAGHRGHRAHQCDAPRPRRRRQHHGDEQHVGGDGEDRTLDEGKPRPAPPARGGARRGPWSSRKARRSTEACPRLSEMARWRAGPRFNSRAGARQSPGGAPLSLIISLGIARVGHVQWPWSGSDGQGIDEHEVQSGPQTNRLGL